jgi:uncharacterized protein
MNYDIKDYDGSLIHKRFGYELFKDEYNPLGVITAFRGKMDVTDNLIDLEDKLNNDFIYSDDALNFCWEIPNLCPLGAVFFQRLFAQQIGETLGSGFFGALEVMVEGDDIMIRRPEDENFGKASVSITKVVDGNVALGHLAVNIFAGEKAPSFAFSLNLEDHKVDFLAKTIKELFYSSLKSCFIATTKVII